MSSTTPTPTCCDDRQEPPSWLNESLVLKAMANDPLMVGHTESRIEKFVVSQATAPGDNYCSTLYRMEATLEGSGTVYSLLVKMLPEGDDKEVDTGLFDKEIEMLAKYIPAAEVILGKMSPTNFPPIAARCLLHGPSSAPFLVLEDLKPQGFRLADRRRGLGLRHSLVALRSLARFHGASAALLAEDPSIIDKMPNPMYLGEKYWAEYVNSIIQMAADACRRWPEFSEYADLFETHLVSKAMKLIIKSVDAIPGKFNVIVHGDFWVNNFMYKYEDRNPAEFRMIDLQLSFVSSPAIDVINFLYSSVSDDVSERHEALLLREYHLELNETLKLVGQPQIAFEDLQEAIDCRGAFALFTLLGTLPLVRAERAPDMAGWDVTGNTFMFENPSVQSWMQRLLPEFKRRGWMKF